MSYEIRNDKLLRESYESGRRQALNESAPRPHQSLPNRTMVDKFGNVVAPPSTTVPGWEEEDFDRPKWPWWAYLMVTPYWLAQELDVANRKGLEEAYESGRRQGLNEISGYDTPPYHPVYNPTGTWTDVSGNWPWPSRDKTPYDNPRPRPGENPFIVPKPIPTTPIPENPMSPYPNKWDTPGQYGHGADTPFLFDGGSNL